MRMIFFAAVSCMLVGSASGMEENKSLIALEDVKTVGKHVADFAQGYTMGSAAGLSMGASIIFVDDDNVARKIFTLPISLGASTITMFKAITATRIFCGEEPWKWNRTAYLAGGMSGIFSAALLYAYAMENVCDNIR